jgi:Secretion system C-terminal sorting domain/Two component regulator propeller
MKNVCILTVFMIFSLVATSQWTSYTTTNSNLVNNDVQAIAQDGSGNMWFATEGGVSMFNGTTWTNYTSSGTGMNGNSVQDIIVKGNGDVWVVIYNTSSNGGVFSFNGTTWTDRTSNITNTYMKAIYDESGTTWVGGLFEGLCERSGSNWTKYTTASGLQHDNVMQICEDLSGNIWAATVAGVSMYNGTSFTNYTSSSSPTGLITNGDEVLSIACDPAGVIWTGSKKGFSDGGGISRYDGSWTSYYSQTKWWTIEAIEPANSYYCWFGIGGGQPDGARIFNGTTFTTINTSTSGLVNNNMNDIFIDNQKGVWFATDGGISHLIPSLSITSIDVDHVTCGQGNNGEITINATSTYPDRFYSINGGSSFSTSNNFTNLTPGTYNIVVTDSVFTELDVVVIQDIPPVKFNVSEVEYCYGDTGFLYTNSTNFTWTPNTDVNDATPGVVYFTSDINQTYVVSMTDSNGCTVDDTLDIIVNPVPTANVSVVDDSVFTANGGYTSYQWYFYGSLISGETDSTYTATAPGIYTVAVTNSFGCTTYSGMIHYNNAGIDEHANNFNIYPNPSNGVFTIETSINTDVVIEVMDVKGQVVYQTTTFINNKMNVDLSNLSKSLYFIRILYDDKMEVKQLMIK